ncbi:hypothetical protein FG05_11859 [Fusarium graminearum]|nr:hypothetical protein FG05_11859 [Fusarium graminearum]
MQRVSQAGNRSFVLVVTKPALVSQWESEIARHFKPAEQQKQLEDSESATDAESQREGEITRHLNRALLWLVLSALSICVQKVEYDSEYTSTQRLWTLLIASKVRKAKFIETEAFMNSLFQQDNEYDMHALWTQTSNFLSPAKMISKRSGKTSKKIPLMTTTMTGKDYMYNKDVLGDDDDEAESTPYQAPERQPKPGTFDSTQRSPKNG